MLVLMAMKDGICCSFKEPYTYITAITLSFDSVCTCYIDVDDAVSLDWIMAKVCAWIHTYVGMKYVATKDQSNEVRASSNVSRFMCTYVPWVVCGS